MKYLPNYIVIVVLIILISLSIYNIFCYVFFNCGMFELVEYKRVNVKKYEVKLYSEKKGYLTKVILMESSPVKGKMYILFKKPTHAEIFLTTYVNIIGDICVLSILIYSIYSLIGNTPLVRW